MFTGFKYWAKIMLSVFAVYVIYSVIYVLVTGETEHVVGYYVGSSLHILTFWFLIPRFILRTIMKKLRKPTVSAVSLPLPR